MSPEPTAALSAHEREVWHSIKTLSEQALFRVGSEIEAASGLSGADFSVLSRLEDLGNGQLSQRDLGRFLNWQRSRLSHQLARMQGRQLLTRTPRDSAGPALIHISQGGQQALAAARPVHARAVRRHLLRHIAPEHAEVLVALARRLTSAD